MEFKMNRWGIPKWLEEEVSARDNTCIYCRVKFLNVVPRNDSRKAMATWEHIINDASIKTLENIALCCAACNSSKGTKKLSDWINSDYCNKKGIKKSTVAPIVRKALQGS
jgi:hypothetical protein